MLISIQVGILAISILGFPLQQQAQETLASAQSLATAVATATAYPHYKVNHKPLISKRNAWSMS